MKPLLRILHLEDDPSDAELVRATLTAEHIGLEVNWVDTRSKYTEALQQGGFDLILSDFKIPSFDGISALTIAKGKHPEVPFIFVSATIGEDRAIDAVKLGATDYVLKDRLARLAPAVRRALTEVEEKAKRKEVEEQYRLITENMADLVAVLDLEGRRLYNSASYKSLLGEPASLRGTSSFDEIHPDDRERIARIFQETVRSGIGQRAEYRLLTKDGSTRHVESQGSVIRDDKGHASKVVVVSRDVTERKRLEEQLLHSQKMESIGTLAGGIAHDFNNVLGIILGYLSLISKGTMEPAKLAASIEAMNTAVRRGAGLVRQLLAFARKSEVLLASMHVNSAIEEVVTMCSQTFPKTISFGLDLGSKIPTIVADANQLHQALLNLCVNSRDAMPDGGTLSVSTRVVHKAEIIRDLPDASFDEYVRIVVADTGTGMDAATLTRIFEPFFTTKGIGKGTGLGLAMVYGVINSHRGLIDVKSVVGKGTSFHLFFPVTNSNTVTPDLVMNPEVDVAGGIETILLVEDEADQVVLVDTLLTEFGYTVLIARNGIEAVETFKKNSEKIALVLTDLGLPKLGGWDAFQQMKRIKPEIGAIIATGYVDARSRSRMLKNGAKDFIQKPYAPAALLVKVREVLDSQSVA